MATRTEDLDTLSVQNNLNNRKMDQGRTLVGPDNTTAVLNEALTHQMLERMAEQRSSCKTICPWISLIVSLVGILVATCCILVALQSYGFLPKYSDEQNLKDRLTEKINALTSCIAEKKELNEMLQAPNLLPVVNEQFCTPMLQQNDANRQHHIDELQGKVNDLATCNAEIVKQRQEIDLLKEEKLTLRGGLMEAEVKLKALVAHSEENGEKCDGWLCSGVKVLYDVVKDTVADKKQKN